jgi:hypothetical protein
MRCLRAVNVYSSTRRGHELTKVRRAYGVTVRGVLEVHNGQTRGEQRDRIASCVVPRKNQTLLVTTRPQKKLLTGQTGLLE